VSFVVHIALAPAGATPFCMAYNWEQPLRIEESERAPTCLICIHWAGNGNPWAIRRTVDYRQVILLDD
jgi:hypothetical protein